MCNNYDPWQIGALLCSGEKTSMKRLRLSVLKLQMRYNFHVISFYHYHNIIITKIYKYPIQNIVQAHFKP